MKKDYNYIASVEKAIAEKYGKCAAQDFRGSWDEESEKDYLGQIRKKNEIKNRDNFKKEETLVGDIRITRRAKEEEELIVGAGEAVEGEEVGSEDSVKDEKTEED